MKGSPALQADLSAEEMNRRRYVRASAGKMGLRRGLM